MFQKLSILGILAAAAVAAGHYVLFALRAGGPDKSGSPPIKRFSLWERFLLVLTMGSLLALAATGFYAAVCGEAMHGYLLMLHVTFAPPFILGLLGLRDLPAGRFDVPQKTYFWLLAAAGVVLTLTAVLSMMPLAGTYWQGMLYESHRYTALVLLMATIVHLYVCTLARPGAWWAILTGNVRLNWAKRYHSLWAREHMPEDLVKSG